ncbi:MAG: XRE family transcriptional regulator [bacterium]
MEEDVKEIAVGEKIKKLREEKGVSLQEFATRTGFSSALLSQIENHMVSPPLGTLIAISKALEVEIGYFFEAVREAPFTIVRHDQRKNISRVAAKNGKRYGYSYESLAFDMKGRHMEPFFVTLEPATVKDSHLYSHEGEEFIFVLEGKMQVQLGDHMDILEPGDSIYYNSMVPHRVQCVDDKDTIIVACIYTGQQILDGVAGAQKNEESEE